MGNYAEFARTKGAKDKQKRKGRGAMIAGGVAGASALGAGGYAYSRRGESIPSGQKRLMPVGGNVRRGGDPLAVYDPKVANSLRSQVMGIGYDLKSRSATAGKAILGTTKTGRILRGAGALGAGATGAAGIMAYLNAKKKAKKAKQSSGLRGRISSAMGRK